MKHALWIVLLLAATSGCIITDGEPIAAVVPLDQDPAPVDLVSYREVPVMNLPLDARCRNWTRGGSCYHASTISCLRWQGQDEIATWWRATYSGGESTQGLSDKMTRKGLKFACCYNGDPAFLDWACRTRRGAAITYYPSHAINIVHLDAEKAILMNNNSVERLITVPRAEFLHNWKHKYGGGAIVPVLSPAPPLPHQ